MLEQTTLNAPRNFLRTVSKALGIQSGEGLIFTLLFSQAFCLGITMSTYYTTANSLFLSVFGAETMPYIYISAAFTLVATGAIFAQLEQRIPIAALLVGTQAFLLGSILILWASLQIITAPWLTFIVMVWLRLIWVIGNFQLGVQIGYVFDLRQAKRLYALIVAAPVFAIISLSLFTASLINLIGIVHLLLLGAGGLVLSMIFLFIIIRQTKKTFTTTPQSKKSNQTQARTSLRTILKNRFVIFFIIFTILSTLNTNVLDYAFVTEADNNFSNADTLGQFFGSYLGVSTLLLLVIALSTARIFKRYGVKGGILFNPTFVGIGGLVALLIGGVFNWVEALFWLTVVTKLMDDGFVVLNTSRRNLLYQPMPDAQRVTVQTLIESVTAPISLGLVGVMLLSLQLIGDFDTFYILSLFLILIIATLISGIFLNRSYISQLKQALTGRHLTTDTLNPFLVNKDEVTVFQQSLTNPQPGVVIYALMTLGQSNPELLPQALPDLLNHPVADVRQAALEYIEGTELHDLLPLVKEQVKIESEASVRGVALRTLAALGKGETRDAVFDYLNDPDVVVRQGAMIGLLRSGGLRGTLLGGQKLLNMVESPDPLERTSAAQILGKIGSHTFYDPLIQLLEDDVPQVQRAAVIATGQLKSAYLWPLVVEKLKSPQVSSAAISALVAGGEETIPALEDAFNCPNQSSGVLIAITQVLTRIQGEQAIACLQKKWIYPDPTIRTAIWQALSRCGYHVAGQVMVETEQELAAEFAYTAWLLGIQVNLEAKMSPNHPSEVILFLQTTLNHYLNQARSRIFYLLSFMYPDAQSILQAKEIFENTLAPAKQKAYALEFLDVSLPQPVKDKILRLVAANSYREQLTVLKSDYPQPTHTLEQCLLGLITAPKSQAPPWLKACAVHTIGDLGYQSLAGAIRKRLATPDPLLKESTIWALNCLGVLNKGDWQAFETDLNPDIAHFATQLKKYQTTGTKTMLSTIERILFLKGIDLFEQLSGEDLIRIAQVAQKVTFNPQETILQEGTLGDCLYIIIAGEAEIQVEEVGQVAKLGEKSVIGEMAILAGNYRTATAIALTEVTALKIEREDFHILLAEKPDLALGIFKVLVDRLEQASRKV